MMEISKIKEGLEVIKRIHSRGIDVINKANGKRNYKEIAKIVGIHGTTCSRLLSLARKQNLVEKINSFYKKSKAIKGLDLLKEVKKERIPEERRLTKGKTITKENILRIRGIDICPKDPYLTSAIIANAREMANYYGWVFSLENALRELIRKSFENEIDWWDNFVPSGVKRDVEKTIKKEKYFQSKRRDKLEYSHLGHLKEIIISGKNWNRFSKILKEKNKQNFIFLMDRIIPSRHTIAHNVSLKKDDQKRIVLNVKDILKTFP